CEQSVLNCTFSMRVLLASKMLTAVSAVSVVFPALEATTSITSPSATLAGVPVSRHTPPPPPSVTRMRTGAGVGVPTNCVHLIVSLGWELFMAAQPPPSYWSRREATLPRQFGGGG